MASARSIGLLAALTLATLPGAAETRILRVTGDRVNLRAQPAPEVEVVGQMMAGDLLATPDPDATGEWVRVVAPQSVDLWVYSELLRKGRVTVNKAQVRGGPGLQFKRVGELTRDTPVTIRGTLGDWTRIAPTSDCFLWISRSYTAPLLPDAAAATGAPPPEEDATPDMPTPAADAPAPAADALPAPVPPAIPVPLPEATAALPAPVPPAIPVLLPEATAVPPAVPAANAAPPSPAPVAPPRLPPLLAGYTPDAQRPQNRPARFTGRLTRASHAAAPGFGDYQIMADASRRVRGEALCLLIGLEGQLKSLAGCQVEVQGAVWHLSGYPVPVLEARRLLLLAPPP